MVYLRFRQGAPALFALYYICGMTRPVDCTVFDRKLSRRNIRVEHYIKLQAGYDERVESPWQQRTPNIISRRSHRDALCCPLAELNDRKLTSATLWGEHGPPRLGFGPGLASFALRDPGKYPG